MNRRDALKLGIGAAISTAVGAIGAPSAAWGQTSPSLEALLKEFQSPGEAARPRVWWHWMNGNITWDGAKKDMDWMKRVGIGGLQAFDAGQATPQVVEERLPYMTAGWKDVFHKVATYADQQNLELGVAGSPGWSETGGPWVTGPDAMKKMVWSVTRVQGGARFTGTLPSPPKITGVFQTSTGGSILGGRAPGQDPPEFYADQKVIAFKVPAGAALPEPKITVSGGTLKAGGLSDGDIQAAAIELPAAREAGGISWIQFDYGAPVVVRGLSFATPLMAAYYNGLDLSLRNGTPPTIFRLESSDDGQSWKDTGAKVQTGAPQRTISVDSVRARYFRFVSEKAATPPPYRPRRFERPRGPVPEMVPIAELVLRGEATVHSFEEKAAFYNNSHYYDLPSGTQGTDAPKAAQVVDCTSSMTPDGRLDWTPPAGDWVVLRIGYSLTGAMNRPASPEATGLEVDKLDAAAVKRYMDHYLGMYEDASGGEMGKRGLRAMMFDSWEAGNQNWTPAILDDFKRLRGYDPTPWLPALAGYVIEGPEQSDAFLWDWRRTIQQLLKVNHYEQITGILHKIGMIRYGEAHEELFATMGDGMEMKQSADIPMGAMWQVDTPGTIEGVYFNDLQESASVAHIYGQNITSCESLTGGPAFGSAPWDLKPTADAILLAGVNRIVVHTSTHQPVDRGPGMTLGVGQYFTRNETWAEQARPWVEYLTRASYLLQQGQAVRDIAVFYGEASPVISNYREDYPAVPEGYRYDYVNADVILNRLAVQNGDLTTKTGMRYRALFFGRGTKRVSLPVLEKVRTMVEAGAVLIGTRPEGSPSHADDPQKVKACLDALWPGGNDAKVGKGRVFAADDTAASIQAMGLVPDFAYEKPGADSHLMHIHRRSERGDIYFVANRVDRSESVEATFRVKGKTPEIWDPSTGRTVPVSYKIEGDRTHVTVPFDRFGAMFVVFFKSAAQPALTVAAVRPEQIATVDGPWHVSFQAGRGAPAETVLDKLIDFRDSSEPGIRYFSGIATYSTDVTLERDQINSKKPLWLDLGQVCDLAEVWVNGKKVGTTWKPPYRVDIASAVTAGVNKVEIRAVNLWVNRLIGDVQPGVTQKITFTAADGKPTAGAGRAARMPYAANAKLRASGLIGPVKILS